MCTHTAEQLVVEVKLHISLLLEDLKDLDSFGNDLVQSPFNEYE